MAASKKARVSNAILKGVGKLGTSASRVGNLDYHLDGRIEGNRRLRIAYIMSRFPKISETFILNEIVMLKKLGVDVEIYPLLRARAPVRHAAAEELVKEAHFHPFLSMPILRAQWHFIRRSPGEYFKTLGEVLRSTFGSANFFVGAIGIFPKVVRFAYEMQKSGITRVHAHFVNHPAVAALIIKRLTGIPYSFTAHGTDLHCEQRMLDKKVNEAEFAVTISNYNKEFMIENRCGEEARSKINVIRCGIDTDLFAPDANGETSEVLRIICVGTYELRVKGHEYLVEACRLLKMRGVRFQCHLVGDGPLRKEIERNVAAAGLHEEVILHGYVKSEGVAALLKTSDVLVHPSVPMPRGDREGIPVAIMEAMAVALPVVATRVSGIPELVEPEHTGILVEPRSVVGLADAIERVARDEELRVKMGSAGRQKILQEYNLSRSVAALLELFQRDGSVDPGDGKTVPDVAHP